MGDNWKVELANSSADFEGKRVSYSSSSLFILIIAPKDLIYDREALGEIILHGEEFGCIDPPGPNGGFGDIINQHLLEKNNGKILAEEIKQIASSKAFVDETFPFLDGIFYADFDEHVFREMNHDRVALFSMIDNGADDVCLEIVEYEPD